MHGAAAAVAASRGHDRNMSVNLESEIEYLEALGMGDHGVGIAEHANFGRTTPSKKLNRQKTQQAIDELEMLWVTGAFDLHDAHWVDGYKFNSLIGVLLILNAASIGMQTELCVRYDVCDVFVFKVAENLFTLLFVIEIGIRMSVHKLEFFFDGWNVMDILFVGLGLADSYLFELLFSGSTIESNISALRLLRLLRIVRVIRLLRIFKELWLLVNGFIQAMRVLVWLMILLALIIYCAAIIATMMVGEECEEYGQIFVRCEDFFGGVFRSMFTLFQMMTLESWAMSVARPVMTRQPAMAGFFVVFLFLTAYGCMNILIGVVCENTLATAAQNERKRTRLRSKELRRNFSNLREVFLHGDSDGDGFITLDELEQCLMRSDVEEKLESVGLPRSDARELFLILDVDDSGQIDVEEFINGILKLKGECRPKDLMGLIMNQKQLMRRLDGVEKLLSPYQPLLDRVPSLVAALNGPQSVVKLP
jgi:voltage-gated sodium channel